MTRILVLVTSLDRGGIETMLMNYYRRLDKRKFQFDFLINRTKKGAYEEEIRSLGGKIYRMAPMYPWKYWQYRQELSDFLRKHPEYQIIHSHLEERSYWPLAIARRHGVPYRIAHIHNYYPLTLDPKTPWRQWFRWRLRQRGLVTARLACSKVAGKWLYGKVAFTVVPDAVETEKFQFAATRREVIREQLEVAPDAVVIGQVGRLVEQKNPLFTLAVFGAAGKVRESEGRRLDMLVYVGKGPLERRLRQQVSQTLGKSQEVAIVSPVSNIEDYYMAFDALVMPSRYEGLGMVAVEAGLTGLPVLASEQVPEEANVAQTMKFLPLKQPWSWMMELDKLEVVDAAQRARGSAKAQKLAVEAGYDVAGAVKKLEEFYEGLTY
jgi:glycosyltransferase involved in cell wall biosynthesis